MTNFVPEPPPIFQAAIEKALAKDPAQRFQTGEELDEMLRTLKHRLDKAMAQTGTGSLGAPAETTQQHMTPPGPAGG